MVNPPLVGLILALGAPAAAATAPPAASQIPSSPVSFGVFTARFTPDGTFTLEGDRWPSFKGSWKADGEAIELLTSGGPDGCDGPGRYRVRLDDGRLSLDLVSDGCAPRRMILDRSTWSPPGEKKSVPERRIVRTAPGRPAARSKG